MKPIDKVLDAVLKKGPVLPMDIASEVSMDSLIASAYLEELSAQGKVIKSKEVIGGAHIYLAPGQELKLAGKMKSLNAPAKTVAAFATKTQVSDPALAKKREEFQERFKDAIDSEPTKPAKPLISENQKIIFTEAIKQLEKPKEAPTLLAVAKTLVKKATPKRAVPDTEFPNKAIAYLEENKINVIEKHKKKRSKDIDIIADMPSPLGTMQLFVKIKPKKTLSESDLSLILREGMERNMPVLLVTNAKIGKKALEFQKKVSGFLKIKQLQ